LGFVKSMEQRPWNSNLNLVFKIAKIK
jgi:hypothetical protein